VLHETQGSIFDAICDTLVCPVNCVGVMGAGLARAFAQRFPNLAGMHRGLCQQGILTIETPNLVVYHDRAQSVILLATKKDWRDPSEIAYIEAGLKTLVERIQSRRWGVGMLAVPALGCGLGGLDWADVKPLMEQYLGQLTIPVAIYLPKGGFHGQTVTL
jgi:O-acetyl-ADP-ribose deacetylase (regulator of RNase III)